MQPTINNERIHLIDLLRGFALLGLPFVNVIGLWMPHLNLSGTETDIVIQRLLYIFIEGRFYAIFSFLFGVGVYIFLSRAKRKHKNYMIIYIRRMIILFFIGVIHQYFQPGEALLFYAIIGIILIPFTKMPKQLNAIIGFIGILIGSILGAKIILPLPFMLLGLAFGQYRIFEMYAEYKKTWLAVTGLSLFAMLAMVMYLWMQAPVLGMTTYIAGQDVPEFQAHANMEFYQFAKLSLMLSPIFTVFYISFFVVIEPNLKRSLFPLTAFGRMAFTNYIGQTVILLLVLQFLIKGSVVSYVYAMITCLAVVMIQMIFSVVWLAFFAYGPLEWIWRCGTYKKILPIKRK